MKYWKIDSFDLENLNQNMSCKIEKKESTFEWIEPRV